MKNTDVVMLAKMVFLVVCGEEIRKREEVNALVLNARDRDIMAVGYLTRLRRAYGPDVEIFETHEWLPMTCSRSVASGLARSSFSFEEAEGVEEESHVRDLSDNSVSGIYMENPRDYCLECGSDYKLITTDYYGCPCCDGDR